eukprot:jgi/Mesvir1/27923/Mv01393-RA.1
MTLTNATIANGVLTLPANGSASSAEADIGSALTGSYQIGFNIKAGAAALTVFRFCDSSLSLASGIRLAVTSSGWVQVSVAGVSRASSYVVITPNQKNRILFRRLKYSADNSTFQMFANGVPVALNMSGYTAATAFAADIPSPAKSYYFADGGISPSSQYDLLFTGIVKPVDASLLSATGGNPLSVSASIASPVNMCELMAVGDTSTAANVSVWVWQGGRILMATGAAYNASTVPLVGAREVVIGLQLHPTLGPRLYVNGALKTSSFAGWKNISDNSSLASPPLIAMNATQAKRGLFLGSRTVYTSGTAFNVAYKSWRVVNTSGMTDAQVENTQLYRYSTEYDAGPLRRNVSPPGRTVRGGGGGISEEEAVFERGVLER